MMFPSNNITAALTRAEVYAKNAINEELARFFVRE